MFNEIFALRRPSSVDAIENKLDRRRRSSFDGAASEARVIEMRKWHPKKRLSTVDRVKINFISSFFKCSAFGCFSSPQVLFTFVPRSFISTRFDPLPCKIAKVELPKSRPRKKKQLSGKMTEICKWAIRKRKYLEAEKAFNEQKKSEEIEIEDSKRFSPKHTKAPRKTSNDCVHRIFNMNDRLSRVLFNLKTENFSNWWSFKQNPFRALRFLWVSLCQCELYDVSHLLTCRPHGLIWSQYLRVVSRVKWV